MHRQRIDRLGVRHRIGGQRADAGVVAFAFDGLRRERDGGQAGVEPAHAATVHGAADVIAAHVVGQRYVFLRIRAHPFGAELQAPDFCSAEMLDNFRAGLRRVAAVKDAARRQAARLVGVGHPPLRPFAAGLIERERAIRLRPAEVERDPAARDDGPHAVVHLALRFVLIETEMQPAPQVIAGLRAAARDARRNASCERIRGAGIVLVRIFEERRDIAPRRETDAKDVRIFRGVNNLIELCRIEAAFEADLHRQFRQRHRRIKRAAAAEFPVRARDRCFTGDDAFHRFVIACDERRFRRIEARRHIGQGVGLYDQRLRVGAGTVDDAAHDRTGNGGAVRIFCDRNLQPVIAFCVHRGAHGGAEPCAHAGVVALPRARQSHVAEAALHVLMVSGLPRLGTSCHIRPLAFAMSTGLVTTKVAT